ncbi:MAG: glycosyltransferase [Lachnospiraceae bacterium]|nr:glycosyltransferase [Lachnospiraceae bacterium]
MKINVLLYSFNGVDYLGEQLQSILKQDITDKAEIKISVFDDGSTDRTRDILERYHNEGKLDFVEGKGVGKTKGFWELMKKAEDADFFAFSEQDDVWFHEKLSRAVKYLETQAILDGEETEVADGPLLYVSDYTVTNAKLKPIRFNRSKACKYSDLEHNLLYSSSPGCTFVFNNAARQKMIKYDVNAFYADMYDDLAKKIINLTGKVVIDRVPTVYMRKNKGDKFGIEYYGSLLGAVKLYKELYFGKTLNAKSETAKALEIVFAEDITDDSRKKEALKQVGGYRDDQVNRERLLQNSRFVVGDYHDKWLAAAIKKNRL